MSYALKRIVSWFAGRDVARTPPPEAVASVVIRPARDADAAELRDLALLDSAAPLSGPALVAVVDGSIAAARGIDDARTVADPFRPSAHVASLLELRVEQLRAAPAGARPRHASLRRRLASRAGA